MHPRKTIIDSPNECDSPSIVTIVYYWIHPFTYLFSHDLTLRVRLPILTIHLNYRARRWLPDNFWTRHYFIGGIYISWFSVNQWCDFIVNSYHIHQWWIEFFLFCFVSILLLHQYKTFYVWAVALPSLTTTINIIIFN